MKSICKNIFSLSLIFISAVVCGNAQAAESGGSGTGSSSSATTADVKYTGVYKERQIIPNSMAIYCKVNAEDILKDVTKLHNCVNQIIRKMNDSDAAKKAAGIEEYNNIKYDELKNMAAQAVAKSGTIANYEELQNKYAEAMATAKTEHEDSVGVANTLSVLTDVVNSMRDLYAERLRNVAIEGMTAVDPSVIVELNNSEDSESSASSDDSKTKKVVGEAFSSTTTYTTENPYVGEGVWQSGNNCEYEICTGKGENVSELECTKEVDTCTDGVYKTSNASKDVICISGNCKEIDVSMEEDETDACSDTTLATATGSLSVSSDGLCSGNCADGKYTLNGYTVACKNKQCKVCSKAESTANQYTFIGNGKCKGTDNKEVTCPDGTYEYNGHKISCINGECAVELDEVVITPDKK